MNISYLLRLGIRPVFRGMNVKDKLVSRFKYTKPRLRGQSRATNSSRATLATKFLSHTHRHADTQTHIQTDIFQELTNRVQDIPERVNPSKTGNRKFERNQYFLLLK